jgi:hypothetical protein
MNNLILPNLEWYTSQSKANGMLPRCPFTSPYRCPRYFQGIWLLSSSGFNTPIEENEYKRLRQIWESSDLWPVINEQCSSVSGSDKKTYSKFCPEVLYDTFGWFATSMSQYGDDDIRERVQKSLASNFSSNVHNDWRWQWEYVSPMHYSSCPLYAPLTVGVFEKGTQRPIGFST